jgi:hypothetical protein
MGVSNSESSINPDLRHHGDSIIDLSKSTLDLLVMSPTSSVNTEPAPSGEGSVDQRSELMRHMLDSATLSVIRSVKGDISSSTHEVSRNLSISAKRTMRNRRLTLTTI